MKKKVTIPAGSILAAIVALLVYLYLRQED